MKNLKKILCYSSLFFCHSGVSQNPVAKNYTKAIVNGWIPDEDFVNAKASTKSSSGMTDGGSSSGMQNLLVASEVEERLMTIRDSHFRGNDRERGNDRNNINFINKKRK